MSNKKQFLSIRQDIQSKKKLLKFEFQKALAGQSLIEKVDLNDDSIEIIETGKKAKLKNVSIRILDFKDKKSSIEAIWRVNLEIPIPGISTQGKTVEMALIISQKYETGDYCLNVCLIEMKSSLQPRRINENAKNDKDVKDVKENSLIEIVQKIQCSMNRMYMLMSLNNHQNRKGYSGVNIHIEFKGIIIFNENELIASDFNNSDVDPKLLAPSKELYETSKDLYKFLTSDNRSGLLSVRTILDDKDKITIKFFPKKDNDSEKHRTLQLGDLL
ncbi:MAG TPA: hypothetical protein DCQ51_19030 [Planktothrix sp. UBA8407]|jgi:hypothetical protein|nr:hypothetical protein [Planktothrix sp. UBA8402]HAO13200.1 hypothetical protein [Planktothrix sp. UBA8407]